eukprot:9471013-Pyramimonas_sp.AAC.2
MPQKAVRHRNSGSRVREDQLDVTVEPGCYPPIRFLGFRQRGSTLFVVGFSSLERRHFTGGCTMTMETLCTQRHTSLPQNIVNARLLSAQPARGRKRRVQ